MAAPRSIAEAEAQCRAMGVDLRVSGKGMSACMDLFDPFCPRGVSSDDVHEFPFCTGEPPSARKAAILLAEAKARANANAVPSSAPLLVVGGVVALGILWVVFRSHVDAVAR